LVSAAGEHSFRRPRMEDPVRSIEVKPICRKRSPRGRISGFAHLMRPAGLAFLAVIAGWPSTGGAKMSAPSIVSSLPDVRSISSANAAGVLQYCLHHGLVSSAATDRVLTPLIASQEVTSSPLYSAGRQGQIISGGKSFSLGHASTYLKSQGCSLVFKQASRFK
jgi:hypothetical protein